MAELLLSTHPNIKGVGVSLDPSDNGNVYLEELNSNPRFKVLLGDVISLARSGANVATECGLPADFPGFDLCIIGITIHQDNQEGDNMNQLKDLLHFCQIYLSLKVIKPGAMAMMRMHMSSRLVDCHLLSFMLSKFDLQCFTAKEKATQLIQLKKDAKPLLKQQAPPAAGTSKLDMLCKKLEQQSLIRQENADIRDERTESSPWWNINHTAIAMKPFSTFSMRKSYWVLYHGFASTNEEKASDLASLEQMIKPHLFPYGYDGDTCTYNLPILMPQPLEQVLGCHGKHMVKVLEQVWAKQIVALRGL